MQSRAPESACEPEDLPSAPCAGCGASGCLTSSSQRCSPDARRGQESACASPPAWAVRGLAETARGTHWQLAKWKQMLEHRHRRWQQLERGHRPLDLSAEGWALSSGVPASSTCSGVHGQGSKNGAGWSSTRARSVANAAGESLGRVEKCATPAAPFRRWTTSPMRCSTANIPAVQHPNGAGRGDSLRATAGAKSGPGRPSCGSIPYLAHRRQERRDSESLERRQHLVRRDRHLERRLEQDLQRGAGASAAQCSDDSIPPHSSG